jgi:spermidine/putrescine transport system ATP-binding protein
VRNFFATDRVKPYYAAVLEIRNIQKSFGSQTALESINLTIEKGEFFSLLGPSGCGKSTLLRILAGLESPTSGEILWNGKRIDQLSARERPFNMVFQKYALFPHLSVFENVAFGPKLKGISKKELDSRVTEAMELVNLRGFENRLPETLSGGQAQRVALARALVNRPACVLLDEPLTALDQKLREHMQTELRLLQRRLGLTFIFVTHDQEEAMLLSDRIAVMNVGRVEQVSVPRELYELPQSQFCARFIGRRNELSVKALKADSGWIDLEVGQGRQPLRGRCVDGAARPDESMNLFVRPERLRIISAGGTHTPGFNVLQGEVIQILFRGVRTEVVIGLPNSTYLRSVIDADAGGMGFGVGDRVGLEFAPDETHVFRAGTT